MTTIRGTRALGSRGGRRTTACVLAVAASLCAAAPVHAGGDEGGGGAHCSRTAELMVQACRFEALDDLRVGQAQCLNLADAAQRQDCDMEARDAHREARASCAEQRDWRLQACALLGEDRYDPPFTPERFDDDFAQLSNPNPYFPLVPGHRWQYAGGPERTEVEVLADTKLVEGVRCIVVRDLVYEEGDLLEATDDWFAAGRDGSSWYCGEEAKDYERFDGDQPPAPELVSIDGSFKHGRDGAKAGIIMPAMPRPGMAYREEFSLGNAEDIGEIVVADYAWGRYPPLDALVPRALAERMCGQGDCVVTRNLSLLEPGAVELKYHARGIGLFLETRPAEGELLQLVGCNFDDRCAGLPTP